MKYKVTITIIEPEQNYSTRDIFEQIIEDLDVAAVIKAANKFV
jgi:hypothetical protein